MILKLKACPFCSCSRIFPQGFIGEDGIGHPMCFKCYATAPTIEDWNTRNNPDREFLVKLGRRDTWADEKYHEELIEEIRKYLEENP